MQDGSDVEPAVGSVWSAEPITRTFSRKKQRTDRPSSGQPATAPAQKAGALATPQLRTPPRAVLSPITPCYPTSKRPTRPQCPPGEPAQTFLNLGQRNFDITTCQTCGFNYAPGVPADEKAHNDHHLRITRTLSAQGLQYERVLSREWKSRVLVLSAEEQRQTKVEEVNALVTKELGLSKGWLMSLDCKMYLYLDMERMVGVAVAQRIKAAYRALPQQAAATASQPPTTPTSGRSMSAAAASRSHHDVTPLQQACAWGAAEPAQHTPLSSRKQRSSRTLKEWLASGAAAATGDGQPTSDLAGDRRHLAGGGSGTASQTSASVACSRACEQQSAAQHGTRSADDGLTSGQPAEAASMQTPQCGDFLYSGCIAAAAAAAGVSGIERPPTAAVASLARKPGQRQQHVGSQLQRDAARQPALRPALWDRGQVERAQCGVRAIWVSREARRRGIASQLLTAIRADLLRPYVVPADKVAFSQLTADGAALAQSYTGRADVLIYM